MAFERKQFTFYRSFLAVTEQLPANKQRDFLMSMINYALNEIEPCTKDKTVKAAFEGIRPVLDKARTKAQQGKIGGCAERKMKANGSEREANGSEREANGSEREAEKEGEKEKEKEIEIEVEGEGEKTNAFASPRKENKEVFQEVFDALRRREVFMEAKDKAECEALCAAYGTRAIIQAIERAYDQHAPRWAYIRAIVTSGGVRGKQNKGGYQRHGDKPSPGMIAAARQMLEDEDL